MEHELVSCTFVHGCIFKLSDEHNCWISGLGDRLRESFAAVPVSESSETALGKITAGTALVRATGPRIIVMHVFDTIVLQ